MRAITAALLAGFLLLAAPAQSQEPDALIETFANVSASVGALYMLQADGDMDYLCSATAVGQEGSDTVVATAYHCLRPGVSYLINFGDNRFYPLRVWKIPDYEVNPRKYPKDFNEPDTDTALLLMEGLTVPTVQLADTSAGLPPGEALAMVGYPMGLAKVRYEGIISGRLDRPGDHRHGYILLQIFGAPGSSGSLVVSQRTGEGIGFLKGGQQVGQGLPVIFASPVEYMENLMLVPGMGGPEADDDDAAE